MGKSETETLPYWSSNREFNMAGQGLWFSSNDQQVVYYMA